MTRRELAKELRRVHRERYGEVALRPDPDDAEELLADAEGELGFALPKLARAVFTYAGESFVELPSAVSAYCELFRPDDAPGDDEYWPPRMLPVKLLSNSDWVCVDCTNPDGPVYVYRDDWDEGGPCWPDRFELVAGSYSDFLQQFIAPGGDWPDARPESDGGVRPEW